MHPQGLRPITIKRDNAAADHANMTCHQHRCCGHAAGTAAVIDATAIDYLLLAATDESVMEDVATILHRIEIAAEHHDLGLRINCRGTNWIAALGQMSDGLSGPARRGLRVALIPLGADTRAFHHALLASQPLETIAQTLHRPSAASAENHFFGDVFKGESLE